MSWIGWIVFGALAGWVASLVVKDQRRGCIMNIIVGILGAVLGGFIYRVATDTPWDFGWDWKSFGVAVLGALLLLVILSLVTRSTTRR
ncbi:GlsB/YeaQ/YmgE family stress response membrane protein [Nakamurella sp. YIM 132087]|uniref:GlsB/YeaQ/YmgE family stress response membrane protein n=1 Tax=Nakamurella alba TaxID=2665158 RepID=A0A7K1FVQ3_9ACTN|nr:GlsB/YeaQ/YmgE family stress response membrane protein [Nakamurella alba]MTD17293.1 GlsB/YeaQ/YmgE family stress response membrane protein [Nakamurella alba]